MIKMQMFLSHFRAVDLLIQRFAYFQRLDFDLLESDDTITQASSTDVEKGANAFPAADAEENKENAQTSSATAVSASVEQLHTQLGVVLEHFDELKLSDAQKLAAILNNKQKSTLKALMRLI